MNNELILDLGSAVIRLRDKDDSSWVIKWCLRQRDKALELEGEERKQFLEDASEKLLRSMENLLPELNWLVNNNKIPRCLVDLELLQALRSRRAPFESRKERDKKKNEVKLIS